MRYGFTTVAGWWRTFHNVDADFVTRCTTKEFGEYMAKKGWSFVDIGPPIEQASEDTSRFGLCFLSWSSPGGRHLIMQLKERRMRRAIDRPLGIPWPDIEVLEWAVQGRMVRDFDMAARATGAAREGQGMVRLGMGTVGCDIKGNQVRAFLEWARQKKVAVGLIEGPPLANWESGMEWCAAVGWGNTIVVEFVTTELGEALARRRKALVVSPNPIDEQSVNHLMVKAVVATPLGAVVNTGKVAEDLVWRFPYKMELVQGAPRDPLPHVAAHVWWEQGAMRENLHGLTGPGRWPLVQRGQEHYEQLYIYDRAGPSGSARALSFEEIWKAQGRTASEWKATVASCEGVPVHAFDEGCKGTGPEPPRRCWR